MRIGRIGLLIIVSVPAWGVSYAQAIRHEYIDVGGYNLHFVLHGLTERDEHGVTIVLESGGGAHAAQWSRVQSLLSEQIAGVVVSYDRAGLGQSDLPDTPYDIHREVVDLHRALTQLGLADRVLLVGHSYGGLLIQIYAFEWPESVSGLVFLDPPAATLNSPTRGQVKIPHLKAAGRAMFTPSASAWQLERQPL